LGRVLLAATRSSAVCGLTLLTTAYLNKTFSTSPIDRAKKTVSFWYKRSTLSSTQNLFSSYNGGGQDGLYITSGNSLAIYAMNGGAGGTVNGVLRDPSAWYHILYVIDTTQATAGNRLKIWINGVNFPSGAWTAYSTPSLNSTADILFFQSTEIGRDDFNSSGYLNGYLTEIYYIDGQALDETYFGEFNATTGVWQPIEYTGTFGTNGFYLNFSDNASTTTLGDDLSGNGNDWSTSGFSVTAGVDNDSLVDTPTPYGTDTGAGGEVRGNYCTWNPLDKNTNLNTVNGNLDVSASNGAWIAAGSTAALAGKIYAETTWTTAGNGFSAQFGLRQSELSNIGAVNPTDAATAWAVYWDTAGTLRSRTNSTITNDVGGSAVNDVYQVAFDADTGDLWLGYNNNWLGGGNPSTATTPTFSGLTSAAGYRFFCATNFGTTTGVFVSNWGQRPFAYTAPSGFKALCTQNLPEPTIVDGGEYFNTLTYTADGTSPKSRTGVGFAPDFLWFKDRDVTFSHALYDIVRGTNKGLQSNTTALENTYTLLSTFGSDGFTTTTDGTVGNLLNNSTDAYVVWAWKANGAGVSNTDGSITSTVSANTDSGFSIVTYTGNITAGATVGHGLYNVNAVDNGAPKMVIVKSRGAAGSWPVWHKNLTGANYYLFLSTTSGEANAGNYWDTTEPTSTVLTLGTDAATNNTQTMVAYCFAEIPGYSAFGSYTGNNVPDGTFVYLGFRPSFLMIKSTSAGTEWVMVDNTRPSTTPGVRNFNLVDTSLYANQTYSEATVGTVNDIDLLSNGFKLRNNTGFVNASQTYIYMAFAESPFKYALAR
jgi:hypothetical protein